MKKLIIKLVYLFRLLSRIFELSTIGKYTYTPTVPPTTPHIARQPHVPLYETKSNNNVSLLTEIEKFLGQETVAKICDTHGARHFSLTRDVSSSSSSSSS